MHSLKIIQLTNRIIMVMICDKVKQQLKVRLFHIRIVRILRQDSQYIYTDN